MTTDPPRLKPVWVRSGYGAAEAAPFQCGIVPEVRRV